MGYEYIKRPLLVANSTSSLLGVTIGSSSSDKVGFYGVAGTTRQASIAAAASATTALNDTVNGIIAVLETLGLISTGS